LRGLGFCGCRGRCQAAGMRNALRVGHPPLQLQHTPAAKC
jgi:hypothetical protein